MHKHDNIYAYVYLYISVFIVVKGRNVGLQGALGSCFRHFRCAFSATYNTYRKSSK